ncbi:MAG: M20/M25/M40 family metallo-hydrolase [Ktedonobacteraceae bacterium]
MLTYSQGYLPKLQTYQPELLERLALLVNIDSGSGQVEGVNKIMVCLEQWLRAAGFAVTLHDSGQFGHNLVARRTGKGQLRLLLVGHVDTVYKAGAATAQPFEIRDDLAYGPGVIDMKSGVLMGLYAVRVLLESGFEDFGEIYIVFNNDEEVGSLGSAPLLTEIAQQVDRGLVLEGARSPEILTHARKGADKYLLEVQGVPAHSGAEPHKGRSAVIELAHKMIAVHQLNTLYPGVTFNVTRINSSELYNIVPDFARCFISVRSYTEQGLELAASALASIAAGCSIPDTHAQLIRTRGRKPYVATPEINTMIEMAKIEGQALGLSIRQESKGGLSDANLLMEAGLPTIDSLGPIGGGMHDLNREYLQLDSIPLRGALLAGLIVRLCLSKSTGTEQ